MIPGNPSRVLWTWEGFSGVRHAGCPSGTGPGHVEFGFVDCRVYALVLDLEAFPLVETDGGGVFFVDGQG